MVDRAALRAADPPGVRRCPFRRQGHMQRCSEAAATDRLAPMRSATRPAGRLHLRPNAENFGGEVSFEPPSRFTSIDHLVGDGEQPRWEAEAECLGGVEVDHELELDRLYDR